MNISGYIPSRNRTQIAFPERSFDEMSWGPNLLMKREEEQDKGISDISTDISNNSYYLDADDKNVAPIVESLQKEADSLASEAATKGYDPMLKDKLIAFRRKYQKALSQNEPWGKAVINYKDATAQWKEWDEAHKNDPQEFKQKAKKYFFGQYQGAVDDETPGQLRGFDAGSLPNYYDVNKDMREAIKDATGKIGKEVGSDGNSIKIDTSSGVPMLRVFNSNLGQYMDNLQPLLAGAQALIDDYSGAYGADTDRARFAKVQGITPEYLANTVTNLTQSQRDAYHSQLPSSSGSYQGVPQYENNNNSRASSKSSGIGMYPTDVRVNVNPKKQKEINKDLEVYNNSFVDRKYNPTKAKEFSKNSQGEKGWAERQLSSIGELKDLIYSKNNPKKPTIENSEEDDFYKKYTTQYSGLWDNYQEAVKSKKPFIINGKTINSEQDWFLEAIKLNQNEAAVLDSRASLTIPNYYKLLQERVSLDKDAKPFTLIDDDGNEGEKISWKDLNDKLDAGGIDKSNLGGWVDSDGNQIIQIPTSKGREEYKVKGIPNTSIQPIKDGINEIRDFYKDYTWSKADVEKVNNHSWGLTNDTRARLYVDPTNIYNKQLYIEKKVPEVDYYGNKTGNMTWQVVDDRATAAGLHQLVTDMEAEILSTKNQ